MKKICFHPFLISPFLVMFQLGVAAGQAKKKKKWGISVLKIMKSFFKKHFVLFIKRPDSPPLRDS